jgi:hypothetical protein
MHTSFCKRLSLMGVLTALPFAVAQPSGLPATASAPTDCFMGQYFRGRGDVAYLELLDIARRMFAPDPEFQNLSMLYTPAWNGLVEGPTWDAWWIQNSYGTTYCALPFLTQPWLTFLQNSQDLWFDQMGDGKTVRPFKPGDRQFDWIPPDGCLCDCARPGWFVAKQGDGRVEIHDWAVEFTAAGVLLQAELLLTTRDTAALQHYLPLLERSANFIETRRDPANNLFLAGPAANLLAPSYAGYRDPHDGQYKPAYLAGLSVTYIAALDRLIELERLAGQPEKVALYAKRRDQARHGLARLTTPEGYFIKSLDPDGTRHGVYGAPRYGYFEAAPNHDAIAFRVVDDTQAARIYDKIAAIPQLRPHDFIIANYPSLDDMYERPDGLWAFGTWVNGGHWSTCEGRMVLAYCRLGHYDDARRSMQRLLTFARRFRLDNPLTKFGSDVYQPDEPINLTYDAFAPAAALVRGLFEYLYTAEKLTLVPHIPPGITELEQRFPIRFGTKQLFLATVGQGPITSVTLNGAPWKSFNSTSVMLTYDELPALAHVRIVLGESAHAPTDMPAALLPAEPADVTTQATGAGPVMPPIAALTAAPAERRIERLQAFHAALVRAGLGSTYEAAHVRLALDCFDTVAARDRLKAAGQLSPLPERSQAAAEKLYLDAAHRLADGWDHVVSRYADSVDPQKRRIHSLWQSK